MVTEELKGKIVFLDTAPLIYFIEGNSAYHQKLQKIFKLNDEGYFKFITSSITLLEVLVKPLKEAETKIADAYKTILANAGGITIIDINVPIATMAAAIRATYNLRTPDALQIATALEHKAHFFLTNDVRLKAIPDIKFIMMADII